MSELNPVEPQLHHAKVHPAAYAVLIAPFGAMSGYVGVAMAFLCTRHELSVTDGAVLIASGMFPHAWKFLWAPSRQQRCTRKRSIYLISVVLCAVGITAMNTRSRWRSATFLVLQATIFIANLACTFLGMSVEGIMAEHATPPERHGVWAGGSRRAT